MFKVTNNIAKTIHKVLSDNKAKNITKINLEKKSSIADYMIICSGTSNRHVISLSNYLVEALKKENLNTLNVEGIRNGDWVLVDAGDIIIHLFRSEVREYYGLEKMWAGEEINSYIK
jgi:ribosome-associated protein|tara:strand:- start:28 stop:378 length:351 start_codon:yes stop_codon:yes gene_type:complete